MKPNQSCILDYYSKKICLGNWLKADLILKIHAILLFHLYCISYMSVMTGDFFFFWAADFHFIQMILYFIAANLCLIHF